MVGTSEGMVGTSVRELWVPLNIQLKIVAHSANNSQSEKKFYSEKEKIFFNLLTKHD